MGKKVPTQAMHFQGQIHSPLQTEIYQDQQLDTSPTSVLTFDSLYTWHPKLSFINGGLSIG